MLYVVAWPVLAEADDTALRRLRAQYHPREADLIGPHFTLVFGAAASRGGAAARRSRRARRPAAVLVRARPPGAPRPDAALARGLPLCRAGRRRAPSSRELHDALNPAPGREPFEPHITLGLFDRAAEAEQVARIVERQHLPMHGRVEELALLRRDGDGLETLASHRLG